MKERRKYFVTEIEIRKSCYELVMNQGKKETLSHKIE